MLKSSAMKAACAMESPLGIHLTRPFRIISTASMPCNVRQAEANEPLPFANQTRFFTVRGAYTDVDGRVVARITPSSALPLPPDRLGSYPRFYPTRRLPRFRNRTGADRKRSHAKLLGEPKLAATFRPGAAGHGDPLWSFVLGVA